jgi:hypothetical protein
MFDNITIEMADHPQAVLDAMDLKRQDIARFERQARMLRLLLIVLVALTILLAVAIYLVFDSGIAAFASAVIPGIAILILYGLYSGRPADVKKHFDEAYYLLWTLRDDTGRKGWVVGTLDLTGIMSHPGRSATNALTPGT